MNVCGIYKIQSASKPDRVYIGSAMNIYKRWEQHLRKLKNNKHHSQKLQRHFNKYGKTDLVFSILLGCEKEDLIKTEQYFIDSLIPYFNGRLKAYNNGGFRLSAEIRKKIGESKKGNKNPNYGKKLSLEHRKKISAATKGNKRNLGRIQSEETKRKISQSKRGKKNPHVGHRPSDKGIETIKQKLKGKIPWNKGVPIRPEAKKKMIESLKRYHLKRRLELSVN